MRQCVSVAQLSFARKPAYPAGWIGTRESHADLFFRARDAHLTRAGTARDSFLASAFNSLGYLISISARSGTMLY